MTTALLFTGLMLFFRAAAEAMLILAKLLSPKNPLAADILEFLAKIIGWFGVGAPSGGYQK